MIYFKWCYNIEKLRNTQAVLTGADSNGIVFAPMIFQDIYAKLGERYAIQLDRSLRKHPFLLARKSQEKRMFSQAN